MLIIAGIVVMTVSLIIMLGTVALSRFGLWPFKSASSSQVKFTEPKVDVYITPPRRTVPVLPLAPARPANPVAVTLERKKIFQRVRFSV